MGAQDVTSVAPCLMFCGEQCGRAQEAIDRYVAAFPDARVVRIDHDPEGRVLHARFELAGREVAAMDSAGPHAFGFTPAISLFVDLDDEADYERARDALADGGSYLMPDQEYPFSPRFCWIGDRYGVSWQLNLVRNESA